MFPKIPPSASKPVTQPGSTQTPARPAVQTRSPGPSAPGNTFTSSFTPAAPRPRLSLDGAPANVPLTTGQPVFWSGQGGDGGSRFDASDEFGYTLTAALARFGEGAVSTLQAVFAQLQRGERPVLSTSVPQVGDVMVWSPNSGSTSSPVGGANAEGHAGVIEQVTYNGDGTVTLRVSEREWDNSDGMTNGVPYRDITVPLNSDGTLGLPDGVGFVSLNPNASGAGATVTGAPATASGTPPLGLNETIDRPGFQIYATPHNTSDGWVQCAGYIRDIPQYTALVGAWTTANGGRLNGGDFPRNSAIPVEGGLMVWQPGAESPSGGTMGSMGHVAYIEEVQENYDANGKLVSYTITISQANADGNGGEERSLETFTVPVDANGVPVFDGVPASSTGAVGFYDPAQGTSSAAPVGNTASNTGGSIQRGTVYSVQQGDTLTSIANRAGVTLDALLAANPGITNPDSISLGQRVNIP